VQIRIHSKEESISPNKNKRGVALLVVLGFVIVLSTLATAFTTNMQVEAILARNSDAESDVDWLCRSGVEYAKYVLSQQMADTETPYDSLNQKWAGGPGVTNGLNLFHDTLNMTNSGWAPGTVIGLLYPDPTLDEEQEIQSWRCSVEIVDLERKFNINRAAGRSMGRYPFEQAFGMMGVDVSLIPYLTDAIIDWCDQDDNVSVNGAESEYYEPLGYVAKNALIDDLRELLLIKDITPEMYWGTAENSLAAGTEPSAVDEGEESLNYAYALVDLFTPLSLGYVNINTASADVLQLIPLPGDPAVTASAIVDMRVGLDGLEGTEDDEPFENVQQLQQVPGFTREAAANAARFMSVRSSTFEVRVTAEVRKQQRTLVAVLQRKDPKDIKILYTYWE
jgi:type II secretory pathway component PulK